MYELLIAKLHDQYRLYSDKFPVVEIREIQADPSISRKSGIELVWSSAQSGVAMEFARFVIAKLRRVKVGAT